MRWVFLKGEMSLVILDVMASTVNWLKENSELISSIAGVATIMAVLVAYRGVSIWKKQHLKKELSEALRDNFFVSERAVRSIRSFRLSYRWNVSIVDSDQMISNSISRGDRDYLRNKKNLLERVRDHDGELRDCLAFLTYCEKPGAGFSAKKILALSRLFESSWNILDAVWNSNSGVRFRELDFGSKEGRKYVRDLRGSDYMALKILDRRDREGEAVVDIVESTLCNLEKIFLIEKKKVLCGVLKSGVLSCKLVWLKMKVNSFAVVSLESHAFACFVSDDGCSKTTGILETKHLPKGKAYIFARWRIVRGFGNSFWRSLRLSMSPKKSEYIEPNYAEEYFKNLYERKSGV